MIQRYHLIFLSMKELTPEATTINWKIILFIMTYKSIFLCKHCKHLEQLALLMHLEHAWISFGSTK